MSISFKSALIAAKTVLTLRDGTTVLSGIQQESWDAAEWSSPFCDPDAHDALFVVAQTTAEKNKKASTGLESEATTDEASSGTIGCGGGTTGGCDSTNGTLEPVGAGDGKEEIWEGRPEGSPVGASLVYGSSHFGEDCGGSEIPDLRIHLSDQIAGVEDTTGTGKKSRELALTGPEDSQSLGREGVARAANEVAGAEAVTSSSQGREGGPGSPFRGPSEISHVALDVDCIRPQQFEESLRMDMDQEVEGLAGSSDPDASFSAGPDENSPSKAISVDLRRMSVGDKELGATSVQATREEVVTFEIEEDQAGTSTSDYVMRASQRVLRALDEAIKGVKAHLEDDDWNAFSPNGSMTVEETMKMVSNAAGGVVINLPLGADQAIVGDYSVCLSMEVSAVLQEVWGAWESVSRIKVPDEPPALKWLRHSGVAAAKERTDKIESAMTNGRFWKNGVNDAAVQTFLQSVHECVQSCVTPEWLAMCKAAADSKTVSCFGAIHAQRLIFEVRGDEMKSTRENLDKMCKQLHDAVVSVKLTDRAVADAVAAGLTHVWAVTSAGIAKKCLEKGKLFGESGEDEARVVIATKLSKTFQEQVLARSMSIMSNLEGGPCASVDAEMGEAAGIGCAEVPETNVRSVEGSQSRGGVLAGGVGKSTMDESPVQGENRESPGSQAAPQIGSALVSANLGARLDQTGSRESVSSARRRLTSPCGSPAGSPEVESPQVTAGPKRGAHPSRDHGDEGTGQVTSVGSPTKKRKKLESKSSEVDRSNIIPTVRRSKDSGSRSRSPCDTEEAEHHKAGTSGNVVRSSSRGRGSAQ